MNDIKPVIETIKKRQSIRTYDARNITKQHWEMIDEYIQNKIHFMSPFGGQGRVELVRVTKNVTDKGIKIGTYGFIKNPRAYLVGITENETYALIDFAYAFEKLVLYLTEHDLGTCWMGGTFDRNSFEKELTLREGEFIPCVTPIGYRKDKQRVFDKAIRLAVKADNKKSWNQLFYDGDFDRPLSNVNTGELEIPFEMVRLGPSASNKQPWRLVLSEDRKECHFYIEHTPKYSDKLGYDMQLLDMGIAMCHFDLACQELNIEGKWLMEDPRLKLPNDQMEYLFSWRTVS